MTCSVLGAVQAAWADGLHSAALWGVGDKVRAEWELTIPAMIKLSNFCCQSFPLAVDFLFPYGNNFCKTAGKCPPPEELSVLELLWIPQWLGHCRAEPDTPGRSGPWLHLQCGEHRTLRVQQHPPAGQQPEN